MSKLPMLDRSLLGTGRFFVGFDELHKITDAMLSAEATAAALHLFCHLCYQRVAFYSEPEDSPSIRDDDKLLAIVAKVKVAHWLEMRPEVAQCFEVKSGVWKLQENSFHISRDSRVPLSATVRNIVLKRDGEICRYCKTAIGPFEIDHIHPVSKGGTDHLDNLTVACRTCNRSKNDKIVEEWLR